MVEYTIDDIRGPTVAREMAQLKSFVLEKFNGAIADAEAAAAQAATDAANAVLSSIDSRVGALEGDMTTAQGDIVTNANAILALDGAVVKLAGAQTISGIKNVPLEATGTASNQIASSQKVKNELDNYAPMVRTTGNQNISGTKSFTAPALRLNGDIVNTGGFGGNIDILDSNGVTAGTIRRYKGTSEDYLQMTISSWIFAGYKNDVLLRITNDNTGTVTLKLFKQSTDLGTSQTTTTSTTVATL